jgi:hypothetical protein
VPPYLARTRDATRLAGRLDHRPGRDILALRHHPQPSGRDAVDTSQVIAATATDPNGNTSSFSACVAVTANVPTPGGINAPAAAVGVFEQGSGGRPSALSILPGIVEATDYFKGIEPGRAFAFTGNPLVPPAARSGVAFRTPCVAQQTLDAAFEAWSHLLVDPWPGNTSSVLVL